MNRSHKIFQWALFLYFGTVLILGFSGQLDRWEAQRYMLPNNILGVIALLFLAFIMLAFSCEPFARWLENNEH